MALVNCCIMKGRENKVLYPWTITKSHASGVTLRHYYNVVKVNIPAESHSRMQLTTGYLGRSKALLDTTSCWGFWSIYKVPGGRGGWKCRNQKCGSSAFDVLMNTQRYLCQCKLPSKKEKQNRERFTLQSCHYSLRGTTCGVVEFSGRLFRGQISS